jgi:hypothetical protein
MMKRLRRYFTEGGTSELRKASANMRENRMMIQTEIEC